MRIVALPAALLTALPAFAHPATITHGHSADWMLPLALGLIGLAGFAARRRAVRAL